MDRNDEQAIVGLLSNYVNTMNNFRRSTPFRTDTAGLGTIKAMDDAINHATARLFELLPPMNLHELTAFSELVNARLAAVRLHHTRRQQGIR